MKRLLYSLLFFFLLVFFGCHSNDGASPTICVEPDVVDGIDVSNHNASIQWDKVAADKKGVSFVYIKSTEGAT